MQCVCGGREGNGVCWKQDTCKRHKGFTEIGVGAANLWLVISMLLNVQCVCIDLKDGHSVLLKKEDFGHGSGIVPPLCFGLAC